MKDRKSSPDDTVWISVPLDAETLKRLKSLSAFCQADDQSVAASLLHDILRDDEMENVRAALAVGNPLPN